MIAALQDEVLIQAKKDYDSQGYCVIDDIYSAQELDEIETFFEDFRSQDHGAYKDGAKYADIDPSKELLRALHPHRFSEKALEWFLHPRMAEVLEALLARPALGAQTMFYYKPPQSVGQAMHQDNFFLLAKPAVCIGAWTPIDDVDDENGCLRMVPESHQLGLICPDEDQADTEAHLKHGEINADEMAKHKAVPVCMRRGQTLLFGGHMIHGSGPNRSKTRSRRTFIGHYVDDATETMSKFYHPILNMKGEVVSHVDVHEGGGPCGEASWEGAVH